MKKFKSLVLFCLSLIVSSNLTYAQKVGKPSNISEVKLKNDKDLYYSHTKNKLCLRFSSYADITKDDDVKIKIDSQAYRYQHGSFSYYDSEISKNFKIDSRELENLKENSDSLVTLRACFPLHRIYSELSDEVGEDITRVENGYRVIEFFVFGVINGHQTTQTTVQHVIEK